MTRLEELTLKLADDELTDSEGRELEALLAAGEPAKQNHIRLLQIEAGLRATKLHSDFAPALMRQLLSEMSESVTNRVMARIKEQAAPAWSRRSPREFRAILARQFFIVIRYFSEHSWIAGTALLALAVCLGAWLFGPTLGRPVLVAVKGDGVTVERGGHRILAVAGLHLEEGDLIRTPGDDTVRITLSPEKTELTITANATVVFTTFSHGKEFTLLSGKLEASVARQRPFRPMILTTPQAQARVIGTRFILSVTTNCTRLDVIEGKVQFTRTSDRAKLRIDTGHYALAGANIELLSLPFAGGILFEWWTGVHGSTVNDFRADPRYPNRPDGSNLMQVFELQPVMTNQFGVRFCGYLHPPVTGNYEFWLTGASGAKLFISPTDNPAEEVPVAYLEDTLKKSEQPHFRGASAWAPPVSLIAGRRYYIEALVLVEHGEAHLSVTWKPSGQLRQPLTGEFLSPYVPR